ncbi:MAG: carbon-nitrogen hydrolase family protein [Candidatus Nitrosopolaris sp.]
MPRVALAQISLQNNQEKAIKHSLKLLNRIGSSDSDIVCLPELWYSKILTNFETQFVKIIDVAKEYNMTVIPGAFIERSKKNDNRSSLLQISSPVITNEGTVLGSQLKIHPFGPQRKVIKAGKKVQVFESSNIKFGIGICYDIVFPEISRALVKKGADILFFPSKIRHEGIKPWHMYVQVRALENRIPIAAPNVCDINNIYKGKSILVDFNYDNKTDIAIPRLRVGSSVNEQILIMDINLNYAKKLRKKRFEELRNDFHV